jgi:sulfite dehydrogenase (quinone) subunit SoeC
MHPALSVILFTTASGAGYGLVVWLAVFTAASLLPLVPGYGLIALTVALVLVTVGLLASSLHLGHPERAWRAFSQWRSSWLSREGVVSVITYAPILLFGLLWTLAGRPSVAAIVAGLIAALLALVTVFCTAMIYASLKPVRQWHLRRVPVNYLLLSLYSGAICLSAVTAFFVPPAARLPGIAAILFGVAAMLGKVLYWRFIARSPASSTPESATGLGAIGKVRLLESPNTEENYLLREMGYRIGRKHAQVLRGFALIAGFVLPILLLVADLLLPPGAAIGLCPVAAVIALVGLLVERWLFFAEATHTVTLYYGRTV